MKGSLRRRLTALGVICAVIGAISVAFVAIAYLNVITGEFAVRTENNMVSGAAVSLEEEMEFLSEGLKTAVPGEEHDIFKAVFTLGDDRPYDYSLFSEECGYLSEGQMVFACLPAAKLSLAAYRSGSKVLVGELREGYFDYAIERLGGEGTRGIFVSAATGRVLLSTDSSECGKDLREDEIFSKNMDAAAQGTDCRNGGVYTKYSVYSAPLGSDPSYSVIYCLESDLLYGKGKKAVFVMLCWLMVNMVLVTLVAMHSAKNISASILPTVDCLDRFSRGEIDTSFKPNTRGDETELLSVAMKTTIDNVGLYIRDIDDVLSKMAAGDLTVSSAVDYKGDFGNIKLSLDNITRSLSGAMSAIKAAGEQVNSGAGALAGGAQTLALNSSAEAETLKELDSLVGGINENVRENTEMINRMESISREVVTSVDRSNRNMEELSTAIEEIKAASSRIRMIVNLIEDISFQTNILALNAAVEAARAGSAGKGFAVVADEVRNLAGRSAEAANNAVELIEKSEEAVEKGVSLNNSVTQSLTEALSSVRELGVLVERISHSSNKQASDINVVSIGISDIAGAVSGNAATAQAAAAGTEELAGQAKVLEKQIGGFRI